MIAEIFENVHDVTFKDFNRIFDQNSDGFFASIGHQSTMEVFELIKNIVNAKFLKTRIVIKLAKDNELDFQVCPF